MRLEKYGIQFLVVVLDMTVVQLPHRHQRQHQHQIHTHTHIQDQDQVIRIQDRDRTIQDTAMAMVIQEDDSSEADGGVLLDLDGDHATACHIIPDHVTAAVVMLAATTAADVAVLAN